jgi:hypothetical protein
MVSLVTVNISKTKFLILRLAHLLLLQVASPVLVTAYQIGVHIHQAVRQDLSTLAGHARAAHPLLVHAIDLEATTLIRVNVRATPASHPS